MNGLVEDGLVVRTRGADDRRRVDYELTTEGGTALDVANAALWLVSDEARYITGTVIPVDAGNINRR